MSNSLSIKDSEIKAAIENHSSFTTQIYYLLKSILDSFNIKYHVIECRTKSYESLREKIERKEVLSLDEITDISGLRIILYYQDDVDKVINIIEDNFIIDENNSMNKRDLYISNQFGYLSVHYIISINKKRDVLPEWINFKKLKAEIQIRTVLQHSWASISHELSYKKNYDIPKELQRKLYRLAGLFELADEQFLDIRDEHNNLKNQIGNMSLLKMEHERINLLTVSHIFQPPNVLEIFKDIHTIAIEAGFSESEDYDLDHDLLSEIVSISQLAGLKNIKDIEDRLLEYKDQLFDFFGSVYSKSSYVWSGDILFFVNIALLYTLDSKSLNTFREQQKSWNSNILERVISTIKQLKKLD